MTRSPRRPRRSRADNAIGVTRLRLQPEFDRLFAALADAERLRLLGTVSYLRCTAAPLAAELDWTRDEAAKQLKLLERAGLVTAERVGRRVEFRRTTATLRAAALWLFRLSASRALPPLQEIEEISEARWIALAGALRNQGRRDMLECMGRGGPNTQDAATADCRLSQGLASRGLKQLVDVGLVGIRNLTPLRRYVADPSVLAGVEKSLSLLIAAAETAEVDHRRFRDARLARLGG